MSTSRDVCENHHKKVLPGDPALLSTRPPHIPRGFLLKTAAEAEAEQKAKLAEEKKKKREWN